MVGREREEGRDPEETARPADRALRARPTDSSIHAADPGMATREGAEMKLRALGSHGPRVSMVGLGCMGMSDFYGPADRAESVATIRAALDGGVTLLDTGDYY